MGGMHTPAFRRVRVDKPFAGDPARAVLEHADTINVCRASRCGASDTRLKMMRGLSTRP